jgi:hypothetical protein
VSGSEFAPFQVNLKKSDFVQIFAALSGFAPGNNVSAMCASVG